MNKKPFLDKYFGSFGVLFKNTLFVYSIDENLFYSLLPFLLSKVSQSRVLALYPFGQLAKEQDAGTPLVMPSLADMTAADHANFGSMSPTGRSLQLDFPPFWRRRSTCGSIHFRIKI